MRFTIRGLSDPPPPPMDWLVPAIVPAAGLITLAGAPGSGKSLLTATLAVAVAAKESWLEMPIGHGATLFLSAEAVESTERRIRSLAGSRSLPTAFGRADGSLIDGGAAQSIMSAIDGVARTFAAPVKLLVLDALSSLTRGADENSGRDMGRALEPLQTVARERRLAIILIAHTPKAGGDTRVRGHSGLLADVDAHLAITGSDTIKTLKVEKMRDAVSGASIKFEVTEAGGVLSIVPKTAKVAGAPEQPFADQMRAKAVLHFLRGCAAERVERRIILHSLREVGTFSKSASEQLRKALLLLRNQGVVTYDDHHVTLINQPPNATPAPKGAGALGPLHWSNEGSNSLQIGPVGVIGTNGVTSLHGGPDD